MIWGNFLRSFVTFSCWWISFFFVDHFHASFSNWKETKQKTENKSSHIFDLSSININSFSFSLTLCWLLIFFPVGWLKRSNLAKRCQRLIIHSTISILLVIFFLHFSSKWYSAGQSILLLHVRIASLQFNWRFVDGKTHGLRCAN